MLMLHRSLAALGRLASKEASRYSITCVFVEDLEKEGKHRVTSTDGKRLMRVTTDKNEKLEPPIARGFDPKANGAKDALVPAGIFTKVLGEIPINKGRDEEFAAVTLEKDQVTFASSGRDMRMKRVTPVEPLASEVTPFPDVKAVFPKGKPAFKIRMSPTLLGELLLAISSVVGQRQGVLLEFYKTDGSESLNPEGPMTLRAKNDKGDVQVEAIIMPLKDNWL